MKIFLCFMVISFGLNSCTTETLIPDNYEHQGKWELQRTKGNIKDAPYEQPDFRESYVFKKNGTFVKTRSDGNIEETAEGTYKLVKKPWTGPGELYCSWI